MTAREVHVGVDAVATGPEIYTVRRPGDRRNGPRVRAGEGQLGRPGGGHGAADQDPLHDGQAERCRVVPNDHCQRNRISQKLVLIARVVSHVVVYRDVVQPRPDVQAQKAVDVRLALDRDRSLALCGQDHVQLLGRGPSVERHVHGDGAVVRDQLDVVDGRRVEVRVGLAVGHVVQERLR